MLMIFIRSNSTYILSLSIKKSIFSDEEFETIIIRLLFRPTILLLVIYFFKIIVSDPIWKLENEILKIDSIFFKDSVVILYKFLRNFSVFSSLSS